MKRGVGVVHAVLGCGPDRAAGVIEQHDVIRVGHRFLRLSPGAITWACAPRSIGSSRIHLRGPPVRLDSGLEEKPLLTGLLRTAHLGPCLVITALTVLVGIAAGVDAATLAGVGIVVMLGQLSIGWSNDVIDAERDRAAGRTDKPIARGEVSARAGMDRRPHVARGIPSAVARLRMVVRHRPRDHRRGGVGVQRPAQAHLGVGPRVHREFRPAPVAGDPRHEPASIRPARRDDRRRVDRAVRAPGQHPSGPRGRREGRRQGPAPSARATRLRHPQLRRPHRGRRCARDPPGQRARSCRSRARHRTRGRGAGARAPPEPVASGVLARRASPRSFSPYSSSSWPRSPERRTGWRVRRHGRAPSRRPRRVLGRRAA